MQMNTLKTVIKVNMANYCICTSHCSTKQVSYMYWWKNDPFDAYCAGAADSPNVI